ncbi:MAG: DUF5615 family PIN-like protein [Gemmatimonadales bacterium]
MKFKIDENVPAEVTGLLRDEDHEATTVFDQQLGGAPDADIAATCSANSGHSLPLMRVSGTSAATHLSSFMG